MKIRVSADSTCDLTEALIAQYDIAVTPLYITFGDRTLRDGTECSPEDIFAYVKKTGHLCSTAAVTIADYGDFFARELEDHEQLVHFTISAEMSACYQNACAAAEDFPGRVFVVDSRNLSTGIAHLVLDAAIMAREGKSGEEIKAILDEKKQRLNVSFILETLNYLVKGGRCSALAAMGANLLSLKPCIEVHADTGTMGVGKKYRGTLRNALLAYVRDRIADRDDVDYSRIFITDSGVDPTIVAELEALLRELGPFKEILHTRAGSTISNHCGPNCLGILYYNKP